MSFITLRGVSPKVDKTMNTDTITISQNNGNNSKLTNSHFYT